MGEGGGPVIVVERSLAYVLIVVMVDKDNGDEAVGCLVELCEISCKTTGVLAATNVDVSIPVVDAIEFSEIDGT